MTWVLVVAMLSGGGLQYSEIGPYASRQDCETEFVRLVRKYQVDGVALVDINGGCYIGDIK